MSVTNHSWDFIYQSIVIVNLNCRFIIVYYFDFVYIYIYTDRNEGKLLIILNCFATRWDSSFSRSVYSAHIHTIVNIYLGDVVLSKGNSYQSCLLSFKKYHLARHCLHPQFTYCLIHIFRCSFSCTFNGDVSYILELYECTLNNIFEICCP